MLAHDERALAARVAYTDAGLHEEERRKTKAQEAAGHEGTVKVSARFEDAREALRTEPRRGAHATSGARVLLCLLVAARFARTEARVQPKRPMHSDFPGVVKNYYGGRTRRRRP